MSNSMINIEENDEFLKLVKKFVFDHLYRTNKNEFHYLIRFQDTNLDKNELFALIGLLLLKSFNLINNKDDILMYDFNKGKDYQFEATFENLKETFVPEKFEKEAYALGIHITIDEPFQENKFVFSYSVQYDDSRYHLDFETNIPEKDRQFKYLPNYILDFLKKLSTN